MWHNNIDYKIIVLCCNTRRKHGHWEVVSAEYIYLYWIYSANNSGIYGSWRVSVRPSGAGLGKTCVNWIYIFVLDIFCQHLGDIWQLEGVCAPFGRWVGKDVLPYCLNRAKLDVFSLPGVDLKWGFPNIWQSISLPFDKVFLSNLEIAFLILITSRCQIVPFSLRCQIDLVPNCPLFIAVPNCPLSIAVPNCPGAKLSYFTLLVPNCPRCQIVLFYTLGAKLSLLHCGAKLS